MPPKPIFRRALKNQQHPIFILAVILAVCLALLVPSARLFLYEAYANRKVSVKSWYKPWRNLPFEDGLWKGVKDFASERRSGSGNRVCRSTQSTDEGEEVDVVLCDEIDGLHFPVCQSKDVEGVSDCLGSFPAPPLGSFGIYNSSRVGCSTRSSRWQPYDSRTANVSWDSVDFARVQDKCIERNEHRYDPEQPSQIERTAIVLRAWDGFHWTDDDLRNVRAMLTELVLFTGGEYQLFVLLHVRSPLHSIPGPGETVDDVKARYVPQELINVTDLWNYTDCRTAYPKVGEYDVYYHTFMPLQLFADRHPEFDFFWNWEMDVRYTGHYHRLLSSLASWAKKQPMEGLWKRNARLQIDSIHGSPAVSKSKKNRMLEKGVGDEAELISLFPLFEISNTLWPHRNYVINYNESEASRPRRGTVNTNMRLSARLLSQMHQENQDLGRTMMSEMWPPTLSLHNDLKAVYVPHPVFLDRRWPAHLLQKTFNAGPGGQVGGSLDTVINQEHDFEGSTWFWNAEFPLQLYERWLGLPDEGVRSPSWEVEHGEMCLPPILLHPIKSQRLLNI